METFETISGFGYYLKGGVVVSKFVLPPGEYPIREGYTAEDVEDQAALDLIEVPPPALTDAQEKNRLIKAKMEELAVVELKKEGKLDANGSLMK